MFFGSDIVGLSTGGTERMRIDSDGDVGIGTTTPGAPLEVAGTIQIKADSNGYLNLGRFSSGYGGAAINGTNFLSFQVDNSDKARIDSSGYLRLAGGGIQFNGDTAAANALDDYEEGTWTPVIHFGGTTATITASTTNNVYVKIGRLVYLNFQAAITNLNAGSGAIDISGFPFSQSGPAYCFGNIQGDDGMAMPAGYASMMQYMTAGNSRILKMNNTTHADFDSSDVGSLPLTFYGFFVYVS
jgi:hypothetical protein